MNRYLPHACNDWQYKLMSLYLKLNAMIQLWHLHRSFDIHLLLYVNGHNGMTVSYVDHKNVRHLQVIENCYEIRRLCDFFLIETNFENDLIAIITKTKENANRNIYSAFFNSNSINWTKVNFSPILFRRSEVLVTVETKKSNRLLFI